ncbi:WD domain [Trypanosoma vivax]|nr:WD domain [Trypanosoma vivax]
MTTYLRRSATSSTRSRSSPCSAARVPPPSARSHSQEPQRWDGILATRSACGTARAIEYIGNRRAWTAEADGRVLIRSLPRGEFLYEAVARPERFCLVLRHVSDKRIWGGFSDGFIHCYDAVTGAVEHEFIQHDGAVNCIASAPCSDYVYSGGDDWKVYQWSKATCSYVRLFAGHTNAVRSVLVVTIGGDSSNSFLDEALSPERMGEEEEEEEDNGDDGTPGRCATSSSGEEYVVSGGDDATIRIWNPRAPLQIEKNLACIRTLRGHVGSVRTMELSPFTQELWSGSDDCTLRIWSCKVIGHHRCIAVLEGQHTAPVTALTSIDTHMWSSGKDGCVVVWDTCDRYALHRFQPGSRIVPQPICAMRRMYRATHWVVALGGLEGPLQCVHSLGDDYYDSSSLCRGQRFRKWQVRGQSDETCGLRLTLKRLVDRNRELEGQLLLLRRQCEGNIDNCLTNCTSLTSISASPELLDRRQRVEQAFEETRSRLATREALLVSPRAAVETKMHGNLEVSPNLKCEGEAEREIIDADVFAATVCGSSGKAPVVQSGFVTPEKARLQESNNIGMVNVSALEAFKNDMEKQLAKEREEREALEAFLEEAMGYKSLWENKKDALRDAYEQIEELQRSLEGEQQYVNELLQELAQTHERQSCLSTEQSSLGPRVQAAPAVPLCVSSIHLYKILPGNHWGDICREYRDVLRDTLLAEFSELISGFGISVSDVVYAAAGDCLLVAITTDPCEVDRLAVQRLVDNYGFPQTRTLQESLSAQFVNNATSTETCVEECRTELIEAKERAEMERDDALQVLQEATDELEVVYARQRHIEQCRSKIPGLLSVSQSPEVENGSGDQTVLEAVVKTPLYVVTTEEYEGVLALLKRAEEERDEALEKLVVLERAVPQTSLPNGVGLESRDSHPTDASGMEPSMHLVGKEEYDAVVSERDKVILERDAALRNLQDAVQELECLGLLLRQTEERLEQPPSEQASVDSHRQTGNLICSVRPHGAEHRPHSPISRKGQVLTKVVQAESGQHDAVHAHSGLYELPVRQDLPSFIAQESVQMESEESTYVLGQSCAECVPPTSFTGVSGSLARNGGEEGSEGASRKVLPHPPHTMQPTGENAGAHTNTQSSVFYRCALGELWVPLVQKYQPLVEDVITMEVYRATKISPDFIRCVRFLKGGSYVDLEVKQSQRREEVHQRLREHQFSVMNSLLCLSRYCQRASSNWCSPPSSSSDALPSSDTKRPGKRVVHDIGVGSADDVGSHCLFPQVEGYDSLISELAVFRRRRSLANRLRMSEETLRGPSGEFEPAVAVDLPSLQQEPIYCVTLDEYRQLMAEVGLSCKRDPHLRLDEDEKTRLWNRHIMERAEDERQFTRLLSLQRTVYKVGS